jgi:hypothetical protein
VPAAERYFAQALELGADDPELVAAHAWAHARVTGNPSLLDTAIDALEAAGRAEQAAVVAARAALSNWYVSGSSATVTALVERAKALLAGTPPSPAHATVLAESARINIFSANYADGEREAAEARRLAEQFGLDELRAAVITTQGVVKMIDGQLEEARAMYVEAASLAPPGSPQLFRALANIASSDSTAGYSEHWLASYTAAMEAVQRAGDRPNIEWMAAQRIQYDVDFGNWDEAVRLTDEYFSHKDPPLYETLLQKAVVAACRGEVEFPRRVREGALAAVDALPDDQFVIPAHLTGAWISWIIGDEDEMRRLIGALWPRLEKSRYRAPGVGARETFTVIRAGYAAEWLSRHRRNAQTRRVVAATLMLEGKVLEAAEAWALVSPHDEAIARLEAARVLQDENQLERGLAFFRAVGARRVIERASAPLRAAAAAE